MGLETIAAVVSAAAATVGTAASGIQSSKQAKKAEQEASDAQAQLDAETKANEIQASSLIRKNRGGTGKNKARDTILTSTLGTTQTGKTLLGA